MHKIKNYLIALLAIGALNSCVEDDDFGIPNINCDAPSLTATKTIQEIFDVSTSNATLYTNQDILEAYVASSDQGGNFFKTISLQAIDGSIGFSVPIDVTDLYTEFEPGRKVYINLQNLYTQIDFDALEVGALFGNNIGRIPATTYRDLVVRSCDIVQEDQIVNQISLRDVSDNYLNTLVEFNNVQFKNNEVGETFYDPNNDLGGATNRLITDELGFELIVRTSSFADFASDAIPDGNGTIRGVLTKFADDYQLLPRTVFDVKLDNPREDFNQLAISALRTFDEDETISDTRYVEGIVILSPNNEDNITGRNAVIQGVTGGIVLRFDSDAHSLVEGDQVRVYLNGLNTDSFSGLKQLETIDEDETLTVNGTTVNRVEVVAQGQALPTATVLTLDQLFSGNYESQVIQIDNVQFIDDEQGETYSGSKTITDCNDLVTMFTRSAASFSGETLASGNGSLVAVSTTFGGVAQLSLRNIDGVAGLTGARCDEPSAFFSENFESLGPTGNGNPVNLAGWVNVDENGNAELWEAREFGGNKYAQGSAFQINDPMKVWLITPAIDLSSVNNASFSFKYTQNFYNGDAVKVLISTDYDGSSTSPQNFTWTDVTSEANLADNNPSGFMNSFSTSNDIDLTSYSGAIYVAFLYEGIGSGVTTNVQIDDLQFVGN